LYAALGVVFASLVFTIGLLAFLAVRLFFSFVSLVSFVSRLFLETLVVKP